MRAMSVSVHDDIYPIKRSGKLLRHPKRVAQAMGDADAKTFYLYDLLGWELIPDSTRVHVPLNSNDLLA